LLVFFIITYNYEQFYEVSKTPNQLSEETHERVNAVIMSIIMAILVIMFYFKSDFNFDPKAGLMKILAKIWIFLNAVLVLSAAVKNYEYIISYGFTYKRLGVFAFLLLSLVGLALTFLKIQKKKKCLSVQYDGLVSLWNHFRMQLYQLGRPCYLAEYGS
jgi:hypothetical protein